MHPRVVRYKRKAATAGIRRFYINDDGSNEPLLEALMDQIVAGLIHYRYWMSEETPGRGRQIDAYDHCLALHGHRHKVNALQ